MNILVVGSGAREHVLVWKAAQSPRVTRLFAAPGNAGTAPLATNLPIAPDDLEGLASAARQHAIDLTLVGPEAPLAAGIVDCFQQEGLTVFGPTQAAAQIEASKVFAKELMRRHGIPTAHAEAFDATAPALAYLQQQDLPVVVKADGLAAGKGVTVATTLQEAEAAVRACLEERAFGEAGARILLEECLQGREMSVFAFTDGETLSPLVAACDYKRVHDGDRGPNTGGMGSYSPPEFWGDSLAAEIQDTIMAPTVRALSREGHPYRGVLYGGLMLTQQGPKVLEFNCRLGDPETQVILPRLRTDLVEVALAVIQGRLHKLTLEWSTDACVGVVVASGGYPGDYQKGCPIQGLDAAADGALVFHAGTRATDDYRIVTDGGRVMTVVGSGPDLEKARVTAYAQAQKVSFQGAFYRQDIACLPLQSEVR